MPKDDTMLLSLDGHDVQAVFTPEQALERVGTFKPQVMLLDIGLPGMDGYEVARCVRALAAGFDDHLVKPVEPERLAQALTRG